MTGPASRERAAQAPGALLYLTEPLRAVLDASLLAAAVPLAPLLPRGDGHPVLVLPGLGGGDAATAPLRAVLSRLGYRCRGWGQGRNIGPTRPAVAGVTGRLSTLAAHGPVSLIGVSLGGIYARRLARQYPAAVRQVITLGAPVGLAGAAAAGPGEPADAERLALGAFPRWPNWPGWRRWYAALPQRTRELGLAEADGPLPVPLTAIYSPLDGIVGEAVCRAEPGEHAENIAVAASHLGFPHHPAVLFAIADRLAQPAGTWAPFRPPALLRAAYPRS